MALDPPPPGAAGVNLCGECHGCLETINKSADASCIGWLPDPCGAVVRKSARLSRSVGETNTQDVYDIANEACIYFYPRKVIPAGAETMICVRSFRDKHPVI
jgi:hypothetical protein